MFEMLKSSACYFQFKSIADMLIIEKMRKNSMGHSEDIEIGFINIIVPPPHTHTNPSH